jgi:HPt (histidine-containing phosphotransfer) domain-containing protein
VLEESRLLQLADTLGADKRAQLLRTFEASLYASLGDIRDALERDDREQLRRVAHMLRGASATVGAKRLSIACRPLEHSGRRADPPVPERQLEALRVLADETCAALRAKLGDGASSVAAPVRSD